jgi:hypothetical protein
MNTVILSVGIGAWYPKGLRRQETALRQTGYHGTIKHWSAQYPPGSPSHQQCPYAFKPYAFKWALDNGYTSALWLDSSIWPQHSIEPILNHIERHGYLVLLNGWTTGEWSTDAQLEAFGYNREEAMQIKHGVGGIIGINFTHPDGLTVYENYLSHSYLFPGAWSNEAGQVSSDPRVLGSRHDQAVLSLIAHKHGLEFTGGADIFTYDVTNPKPILLAQGM